MKIDMLHDRVLVERKKRPEKIGQFYVPETAQGKTTEGEVAAVGPGKILDNGQMVSVHVRVGDWVLFGVYAGSDIVVEGKEYLVLRDEEIVAVLREES